MTRKKNTKKWPEEPGQITVFYKPIWLGFNTTGMEIAAEVYVFRGELDLTEAHDHKDDRWREAKDPGRGRQKKGKLGYTGISLLIR